MAKTNIEVQVTKNYDIFQRMDGNRAVMELRVKKIINSIKAVGYVLNPIIVNENMEVIDGQGRLEALKRLKLPVYYISAKGIGLKECIAMNINQSNWSLMDYIGSYAETGNESYKRLKDLYDVYGNNFTLNTIMFAITLKSMRNIKNIKEGDFVCSEEECDRANGLLMWLTQFTPVLSRLKGCIELYYQVLIFCHIDKEVDTKKLQEKIFALQANLIPVVTILQAVEVIEDIYNNRAKSKVYIKTNYRKWQDEKNKWYSSKYGDRYND